MLLDLLLDVFCILAEQVVLDLDLGVLPLPQPLFEFLYGAREDDNPTHREFHLTEEVSFQHYTILSVFQFFLEEGRPLRYVHNIFVVDRVVRENGFVFVRQGLVILHFPLEFFSNLLRPRGFSGTRCSRHHND